MKRDPQSKRSQKWVERNDINNINTRKYLNNLSKRFSLYVRYALIDETIKDYEQLEDDDIIDRLLIKDYSVFVDEDSVCVILLNITDGTFKTFQDDSCWLLAFEELR